MQRILIVGVSGTGKTRLAKHLSEKLNIPVIFLDSIFWKADWQEEDSKIVESKISQILVQDNWTIEGYIEPLGRERVRRADTILYLDYPGYIAFWGGINRWWQYRGKVRPEMPPGNIESFGWKFLMTMLKRDERPEIEKAINGFEKKVIRLKTRRATTTYISRI